MCCGDISENHHLGCSAKSVNGAVHGGKSARVLECMKARVLPDMIKMAERTSERRCGPHFQ